MVLYLNCLLSYSTPLWYEGQFRVTDGKGRKYFPPYSNVVQYQLFPTPLVGKCMLLPHSLFRCLVHIQFSSLLVQEANPLHSPELDTALLPSAARIPQPHSAGSGCTTTQQTGVKLLTAHNPAPPQTLSLNLSHIIKSTILMSQMLSLGYLSKV